MIYYKYTPFVGRPKLIAVHNLYKGKYYTDVFFKDIEKIVDKPKNAVIYDNEVSLFENHNLIDENGKILL